MRNQLSCSFYHRSQEHDTLYVEKNLTTVKIMSQKVYQYKADLLVCALNAMKISENLTFYLVQTCRHLHFFQIKRQVVLPLAGFNSGVMGAMILLGNVSGALAGISFTVSSLVMLTG